MKSIFQWVVFCLLAAGSAAWAQTAETTSGTLTETLQSGEASVAQTLLTSKYITTLALYDQKDYAGFASQAETFIQQNPAAPKEVMDVLRCNLATVPFMQGKWSEARVALRTFIDENPTASGLLPEAAYNEALCYFHEKAFTEFEQKAQSYFTQYPAATGDKLDQLGFYQAMVPRVKGEWGEAYTKLSAFAASHPSSNPAVEARLQAAECLFQLGRYEEYSAQAASFLAQCTSASAEQREMVTYRQAMVPFMQQKWTEAEQALGAFAAAHPGSKRGVEAQYESLMSLSRKGDLEGFKQKAGVLLAAPPEALTDDAKRELGFGLAMVPFVQGKWSEAQGALEEFAKAHSASPLATEAQYHRMISFFQAREFDAFAQQAASFATEHPQATKEQLDAVPLYLARVMAEQGKWSEAADKYQEIVSATPASTFLVSARQERGRALLKIAPELRKAGKAAEADTAVSDGQVLLSGVRASAQGKLTETQDVEVRCNLRRTILESYYYGEDYANLAEAAKTVTEQCTAPSKEWATGMVWLGIARMRLTPRRS